MSRPNHSGTRRSTILKRRAGSPERLILFIKRFGFAIAGVTILVWVGSWAILSGTAASLERRAERALFDVTAGWGFAVRDILVDGRHHTDPETLKAMIGVERGDPIFAFDPAAARADIEKLPWVKKASIERRLPDTLYVKIEERKPLALWQRRGKLALIDADGVVLSDRDLAPWQSLMIVVGDAAPPRAAELIAMLDAEPVIEERVEAATLVSGRRWDLKLKSGAEVKLPEADLGLALRKLAINHEEEALLDKDVLSIDVREQGRITVRTKPGAAQDFKSKTSGAGAIPAAGKPI